MSKRRVSSQDNPGLLVSGPVSLVMPLPGMGWQEGRVGLHSKGSRMFRIFMLSHTFQLFCSLKIVKSICSLTPVSPALIESVCCTLWDIEKPLAQLLLVNP